LIPENSTIYKIVPTNKSSEKYEIRTLDNNVMFAHYYARIKHFLLARGRSKIVMAMLPHIDNLLYCYTDSMILSVLHNIKTGTNLGDMRNEGYCDSFQINKSGKKTGVFK
jgi:hypothetical protein